MQELYNNYFNIANDQIWKVAIYARLSREDEKDEKYKGQSESIENQIKYLKSIITTKGWLLIDIYKDDGYTGTNFDRPDFKRMLNDIENGKINLVITKDLSRLGRDYIETGRYIEKIFPSKNIRYIAVNDNIDTFDKRNSNNDMTPFKAVINDMYAKDTSNKVRSTILTKAIAGECIKAFLPYGYKKDKTDKNKIYTITIDEFKKISIIDITLEDLNNITPNNLEKYIIFLNNILDNDIKTRNRKLASLKKFFEYLETNNFISLNPARNMTSGRVEKRIPKHLSLIESKQLLSNIIKSKNKKLCNYLCIS